MPVDHVRFAQQKGIKIVMAELLTGAGSRSKTQLQVQKFISRAVERVAPSYFVAAFNWESYRLADAVIANTPWQAYLMNYLFGAPKERIHIVANGVEEIFLNAPGTARKKGRSPRLRCHHHRTQTGSGTGGGRRACQNTTLDHRPGLCRFRFLRSKIFHIGATTFGNHSL